MATRHERTTLAIIKERFLRTIAEHQFELRDLLELFGMAFRAKISEPLSRHFSLGKNYFNAHGLNHQTRGRSHNPPGTKLVRQFIRSGNTEGMEYRKLYFRLTGKRFEVAE